MAVVSNTSPILNLAIIGRLDLLRRQFHEALIPPAVVSELKMETDLAEQKSFVMPANAERCIITEQRSC